MVEQLAGKMAEYSVYSLVEMKVELMVELLAAQLVGWKVEKMAALMDEKWVE